MSDLTREQIEAERRAALSHDIQTRHTMPIERAVALCDMALASLRAEQARERGSRGSV